MRPTNSYDFNNMPVEFRELRNKELQNGRLAMLAVAGMVAQELVDGHSILDHIHDFGFGRNY